MPIQAGSCNINELVQVGVGTNPTGTAMYNSFMAVGNIAGGQTGIPVNTIINGAYAAFGIDPVGHPGVYACPRDFETIYVDRRTDWQLEKRLALAIVAVLLLNFGISFLNRR